MRRVESTSAAPATQRPGLLTPREAADYLAVSERLLWRLTNERDIPCVRLGRLVRYDPADLRGWIERKKTRLADPTVIATESVSSTQQGME